MSTETLQFSDSAQPALDAGFYRIEVRQSLTASNGAQIATDGYFDSPIQQDFQVAAPQLLLPTEEIAGYLPAANAVGELGWKLPQVTLRTRSLPWARSNGSSGPWMALVVLRDDEIVWDGGTQLPYFSVKAGDLNARTGGAPVFFPNIPVDFTQIDRNTPVRVLRLSTSAFAAVMPRSADLPYCWHCRKRSRAGLPDETTAVVTANRYPTSEGTGRNHCFLVSLEGYGPYLVNSPSFGSGYTQVQLVVLQHWTFVATPGAPAGFVSGLQRGVGNANDLLLRVPAPAGIDAGLSARLQQGYVPAQLDTGTGVQTMAWYRGPLSPVVAQPLPITVAKAANASQPMVYVTADGVFDMSYAAAFELGRAIALSDPRFTTQLLALRNACYRILDRLQRYADLAGTQQAPQAMRKMADEDYQYQVLDGQLGGDLATRVQQVPAQDFQERKFARPGRVARKGDERSTVRLLSLPELRQAIEEAVQAQLKPVASWLAQLQLLCGVPFHHLVPDQRMLPPDTLRFFYLDQNWLDSLAAGAKSVGIESNQDSMLYNAMQQVLDQATADAMASYEAVLAGDATGDVLATSPKEAMTGVLLRSTVLGSYDKLSVVATKAGTPLKLLRQERLSDSVMLAIFLDVPDKVVVSEPTSASACGADEGGRLELRYISGGSMGAKNGQLFPGSGDLSRYFRASGTAVGARVLNLNNGTGSLVPDLGRVLSVSLTPGQYAMQCIRSADFFTFIHS